MKKKMFVLVVILAVVFVGVFVRRLEKKERNDTKHEQRDRQSQSLPIARIVADDSESSRINSREITLSDSRVYKPISLQVGQGGVTVVEVDHGLKSVDRFNGERYSDDVEKGKKKGAKGAITLRVIDTTGAPVVGAELFGGFWNNNTDDLPVTGTSDAYGEIPVKGICTGDFNFLITKDGYYRTTLRYWFFKTGFDCARDGRWLPWNPIVEVMLKEKRNPVEMDIQKRLLLSFPVRQVAGIDLVMGEMVAPIGQGKVPDVSFWYDYWLYSDPYCVSNRLTVTTGDGGMLTTMKKDTFSEFKFAYTPPDSEWVSDLALGMVRINDKILSDVSLNENEYWVVSIQRGEKKQFAVISNFEFGGSDRGTNYCGVLLSYYLNPTPDDANLEIKNIR